MEDFQYIQMKLYSEVRYTQMKVLLGTYHLGVQTIFPYFTIS